MGKLASRPPKGPAAVIKTVADTPDTRTFEGAPGFTYDTKSQLFLLGSTNMVSEDTFYEDARTRDSRFVGLVQAVAGKDPEWLASFIQWLRHTANIRTAALVAAVEGGRALAGTAYPRRFLASAISRADEPAEVLGYWLAKYGKPLPTWLKRGLADAADRVYSEYTTFKYDTPTQPYRFADVLEFTDGRHLPPSVERDTLWRWLLDRRHGNDEEVSLTVLPMRHARESLNHLPANLRAEFYDADALKAAGHTWESYASWRNAPWNASAWEAVIPSMGYMALIRNLRNFEEAGISAPARKAVIERLANPEQVAKSRQMPMRFLSAYNATHSDHYRVALGEALDLSLANIPRVGKFTSVLIDTSSSMRDSFSKDGSLKRWDAAAVFGLAFAVANDLPEVMSFSDRASWMPVPKGASLLRLVGEFQRAHFHGGGTHTAAAIATAVTKHPETRRALILTDEQASGGRWGAGTVLPALERVDGPTYTFNLAGYGQGHTDPDNGRHYTIAGLNDSAFHTIARVESGKAQVWPWD